MLKTPKGYRLVCLLLFAAMSFTLTGCDQGGSTTGGLTYGQAQETLTALLTRVNTHEAPLRMDISDNALSSPGEALPDIANYPLSVTGKATINVEIMASTEKAGPNMDGWLNSVAESFNKERRTLGNGKTASVSIRPVASGLATEYIVTGRYVPDAFSPANELWGEMGASANVMMEQVEKRLAGNTAGILMGQKAFDRYTAKYGEVTLSKVIEAVMAGDLLLGYTNPYASSTGLNILTAMLQAFDPENPLSAKAVDKLLAFQAMVPPVAYTTAQMRESAKNGVLDAMIMEYQAYINEPSLKDYVFTPCGVRHDNPVYLTKELQADQREALAAFIAYCKEEASQKEANRFGFNANDEFMGEALGLKGSQLFTAQQVWKNNKDGGRPVVAVFVADISGSMGGTPIQQLKTSLINASQYIGEGNYIGLISYSNEVYRSLPIGEFTGQQKAYFAGAVKDLSEGGNTATYDAVLVGLDMLLKAKADIPNAKLMMFVLSDGQQNAGYDLEKVAPVIQGLGVPIYTIGYNANIEELSKLSSINEASTIDAKDSDVVYKLRDFFNAQM